MGRKATLATKIKMSEAEKGRKRSEKTKRKIRKTLTGRKRPPFSEEWKRKIKESHLGTKVSEKTKLKMGESHRGKKHWNWQGEITLLYFQVRNSFKYSRWRSDIFTRDNFTCVLCGDNQGRNLEADHFPKSFSDIFYNNKIKTIQEALKCGELWEINNGRTLCKKCHKKTDTYGCKKHKSGKQKDFKLLSEAKKDKEEEENKK